MPLGDSWSGVCRAAPAGDWLPDAQTSRIGDENGNWSTESVAREPRLIGARSNFHAASLDSTASRKPSPSRSAPRLCKLGLPRLDNIL